MSRTPFFRRAVCAAVAVLAVASAQATSAQTQSLSIEALMNAQGATESESRLSLVRETALRETAFGLGTRLGLLQRSREIAAEVAKRDRKLDKRFDFGGLMMGPGVLPPVIMESKDAISLEATTMRVSGAIYKIDEPARFVAIAPTWRDWLLLGLPTEDAADMSAVKSLLPRDGAEQAFWKREVAQAVATGRAQAQQIFELNVANLEKTYFGMRLFYDLWKRGMVTIPVIASAQTMVDQESPNTISVGNTMFRITRQAGFEDSSRWKPLE
jgi:defect-in-organelle-trafficking protein DotC